MFHSFMLAAFVSPVLAMAGAGAASIPILIHLFSKRRFRRIRWAAIEFLMEADRRNRRRVRIEELILLALRCLAMLLIGVMLARWFIRPEALMAMLGSTARTERIVLLDDSFSMGVRAQGMGDREQGTVTKDEGGKGATVFDRGKTTIDRLAQWLRQESPADPLTVVLTSRPDRPLRVENSIGQMDLASLRAELDSLAPSSRGGNLPAAFSAVRGMLEGRKSSLSATVYVVSDFQQIDWSRGRGDSTSPATRGDTSGGQVHRSPAAALADLVANDPNKMAVRLVLMDVGIPIKQNLCIASVEPQQAQAIATVSGAYTARITNFSEIESEDTSLHLYVGDAAQPPVPVPRIPPGQTVEVPVEVTFGNEGSEALTVELDPDALPTDNTRSLVVLVSRAMRILVVNGEPSADLYQDEVFLLNVALRPEGPQFSGNEVTVVDENEFEAADLNSYHAVVLANVYRVTEESAARLEDYTAQGGGVAIFLGDQVDAELYNRILYRDGKGLLPAKLGEILSPAADKPGVGMGGINISHPAMRRFRDTQVPYFAGVAAYRYFASEAVGAAAASTAPADHSSTRPSESDQDRGNLLPQTDRGPAQVLLRFDDADKNAVIVERSMGKGKVVLTTTSADKEWNSLPDKPVFLVLAMELIQYIARPAEGGGEQLVGQPIHISLDTAHFQTAAILKLPSFPEDPAITIDAQPDAQAGTPVILWPRTDQPGIYQFSLNETSGGEAIRPVAVNVDPREGDLRRADRTTLLEALSGLPAEYVAGETLTRQQDIQTRRELWPSLLIALLVVLMTEQGLAWWFGGGRLSRT